MLVIGHRGASAEFTENTLAAFRGAVDQGADGVELDVRRTRDGRMAIHHDDVLADGRVIVELDAVDLPDTMTELPAALDACRSLSVVNIEIKNWPEDRDFDAAMQLAADVVTLLEARGELADGRNLVSCFHLPTVDRVHELAPGLATGWLLGVFDDREPLIERAAAHGHVAVHPHDALVDERFVTLAHAAGLAVNVWTVDDPTRLRQLEAMGVDAVITNTPHAALQALGR
jgi:glycerophosphoryl diester phosphodiesterase